MPEQLNDIELRSEAVRDILSRVPPWLIQWGNLIFLTLLIAVLVLSWVIKYPEVVEAEAMLTTSIPPQKAYAQVSGRLDTLLVNNNQFVKENQPLAILESTANISDVFLLKSITDTLSLSADTIEFPFNMLPILFLGEIEPDFAQFENTYFQYKVNKEFQPFESENRANKNTRNELELRLDNIGGQKKIGQNEISYKKVELDRIKSLFEKGVVSKQELENKELEFYTAQRNFQNLAVAESQLRESLSDIDKNTRGNLFDKSRQETKFLKNVLQSYNLLKKAIRDWELKYVLASKTEGKVSFLNYWGENQYVNSGDLVFKVLPAEKTDYLVKLDVNPQKSGKIKVGQKVNISLWDYPEYEFGVIKGTVIQISNTLDDDGFYTVDVSVSDELITSYGKEIEFKQEMRGNADIITEDLRLIERLFYQFRHLFKR